MAEYLNRIGAGLILLDAAPLSYDWVPPSVVGREDEQEQLAAMFSNIGTSGMSCRAVITGNVGSGKTVVALAALLTAVEAGWQGTIMAPTEVLAEQHFASINQFMNKDQCDIYLLTSSIKDRENILDNLNNGKPALYIGTHALIQESIKFSNLGFAIIDEQQRFGVEQRKKLINETGDIPDQLVMTATPIPRTTALSIYGDLEISSINELPPGRTPIKTIVFK